MKYLVLKVAISGNGVIGAKLKMGDFFAMLSSLFEN